MLITMTLTNINTLWPVDVIWRHGTRSTLAQVMACCLTPPSHYLSQCCLSSVRSHGIHLRGLSLDDVKIPIDNTRLKIAVLKWHPGLPGANELTVLDTMRTIIWPNVRPKIYIAYLWPPFFTDTVKLKQQSNQGIHDHILFNVLSSGVD